MVGAALDLRQILRALSAAESRAGNKYGIGSGDRTAGFREVDASLNQAAFSGRAGPRDDHRAHRVRALDMAVVINLDAARLARQVERLLQTSEQLMLRRSIGELAAQRLARVGHRVRDQFPLLATLRHRDIDLAAGFQPKRLGDQRLFWQRVAEQNDGRWRLVVVSASVFDAGLLAIPYRFYGLGSDQCDLSSKI